MTKHIDVDRLRAEIKFAKSVYENPKRVVHGVADAFRQDGQAAMCDDILKKIDSLQQEQESVAERFTRIIRGNLIGIDKEVQQKFEQLYFEVTGNKMYGGTMTNYIPADKLIAEIERLKEPYHPYLSEFESGCKEGRNNALDDILSFITHIQQDKDTLELCSKIWWEEQGWIMIPPDATIEGIDSLLKQIKKKLQQEQSESSNGKFVFPKFLYARTTNNKTIDVSYAPQSLDAIEYVRNDFIEQKQSEMDLEKEYKTWWNSISGKINVEHIMEYYMHETARHFYELGRKQVLQEIYDGKTKPVDKITAAWLDDKEGDK